MIGPVKGKIKKHIGEDTSYKIVALFVTLVLWVTILGRKNSVVNKDMDLEILVRPNHVITNQIRKKVRVQLSGPRMVLKKFAQSDQSYTVDLFDSDPGKHRINLKNSNMDLPVGLKVISVSPKTIVVQLRENPRKGRTGQ
ncbi:MAG: hypothetical protein H6624_06225 [Bdellovibrionaceae bacterium]|nr:hypothetical protein [Bdellovibrionales bacterium]MCB9083920.1 hypothetical protein [Pseudobdellovibrionaceae bacterium]